MDHTAIEFGMMGGGDLSIAHLALYGGRIRHHRPFESLARTPMPTSLELLADLGIDLALPSAETERLLAIVQQVEREARRLRLDVEGYPAWRDRGHTDGRGLTVIAAQIARREGKEIRPFVEAYCQGVRLKGKLLLAGLDSDLPDVVEVYIPPLPDYRL